MGIEEQEAAYVLSHLLSGHNKHKRKYDQLDQCVTQCCLAPSSSELKKQFLIKKQKPQKNQKQNYAKPHSFTKKQLKQQKINILDCVVPFLDQYSLAVLSGDFILFYFF